MIWRSKTGVWREKFIEQNTGDADLTHLLMTSGLQGLVCDSF